MAERLKGKDERKLLREVSSKIEKEPESKFSSIGRGISRFQQQRLGVRSRQFRKGILPSTRDFTKLKGVGTILGIPTTSAEYRRASSTRGRGRPKGSYKRGIPAEQFRTYQRQRESVMRQLREQQLSKYTQRGFSPEEAQRAIEIRRASIETPEKRFKQLVEQQELSPNTVMMLDRLRRVQEKAQLDDFEQQRRNKERRIVAQAGNLMKARNLFGPDSAKFDILEMEGNILTAPNVFKSDGSNNILRPSGRPNILQAKEAGNSLFY